MPLRRKRAELLPPIHNPHRQYKLSELGQQSAYKANRPGVAARLPAPAVQNSIAVDLALLDHYARLRRDRERAVVKTA